MNFTVDAPEHLCRLTASEQLFFHKAPLAHVVAYEEKIRVQRLEERAVSPSRRALRTW